MLVTGQSRVPRVRQLDFVSRGPKITVTDQKEPTDFASHGPKITKHPLKSQEAFYKSYKMHINA